MRIFSLFTYLLVCGADFSLAQQLQSAKKQAVISDHSLVVPPAVAQSARIAVQTLGEKVKAGDLQFAYDTMYPRFKKRQEALVGKEKLREAILNSRNDLIKLGATIDSFEAQQPTGFFKVWPMIKPEIKTKMATGEISETKPGDEYYHWLVIVPTKKVFAFLGQSGGRTRYALVEEYQVAIAKEAQTPGQEQWTFISPVKVQELRSLFPSLPATLQLPALKKREIKK